MTIVVSTPSERLDKWMQMSLMRSIEDVAWSINLSTYDRWSPLNRAPAVVEYDELTVTLDGELVFFGHVFQTRNHYDSTAHTFTIEGRSRSASIVDCSVQPKTWRGKTLQAIATEVLDPFGLAVIVEESAQSAAGGAFARIKAESGERVFDFLVRLTRYRGVLLTTDPVGNVVITAAERRPLQGVTIERGKGKILSAELIRDGSKRYSSYTARAQLPAAGLDTTKPVTISATVSDAGVPLHRPRTLSSDGHSTRAGLKTRAGWERNLRVAQSLSCNYELAGWQARPGLLWAPNQLVPVRDAVLGIETDLLIVDCQFKLGRGQETTRLKLAHPDAYVVARQPVPRKQDDEEGFGFKGAKPV